MDTLKSLMDNHEFELVIKLTEKSSDADSIFYRISAQLGIGQPEKALETLKQHHNLLRKNLYLLIKVHIDLLIILGRFDEAYDELDYYKNLPYESQQVEELLSGLVGYIRKEEKQAYKTITVSDDDLKSRLKSNDQLTVISALEMVQERNIESFLPDIKNAMLNNPSQNARTFALLLLVSKKINVETDFLSSSGIVRINPSVIKPPFVDKKFNDVSRRMISEFKNPTISDNAIDIFSRYILDVYPLEVNEEDDTIVATLFILSSECLQMKDVPTLEEHCRNKKIDFKKAKELYEKFKKIVKNI